MKQLLLGVFLMGAFGLAGELQQLHRNQKAQVQTSPQTSPQTPATKQVAPPGTMALPGTPASPAPPAPDITEIGLERTRCYANCPAYTVIIQADGSFRYVGEYGVERLGEYTGQVSKGRLNQLLAFIAETDFEDFQTSYLSPFLDGPTTYVMVKEAGDTKVIENYANNGPATLWAIEQLIDDLLESAEWDAGGGTR